MILTVSEIISILRSEVNIDLEREDITDSSYLAMSDKDLELFIKLGCSRAYPEVSDLNSLPDGSEYPIVLLAKIELYTKLAVMRADKVDLVADNNNQIKLGSRFTNYMKLVEETREQYKSWLNNEGQGKVQSYDFTLARNIYSQRGYNLTNKPSVTLKIGTITSDSVELDWYAQNCSQFGKYLVYIGTQPIVDKYKEGNNAQDKITSGSKLIKSTLDIHNNCMRVNGLEANTEYYIAVFAITRNSVFGFKEIKFTTLQEFVADEEFEASEV